MGVLVLQDAYLEIGECLVAKGNGEQTDFDIDSDASDADLLELKQGLTKSGPENI